MKREIAHGVRLDQSKSQRAYAYIKDRIVKGDYAPGFRLVLGQLAAELGVSSVPVREAIRLLEAEGLVTFERFVGAHVAMVDTSEYRDAMHTLALLEGYATALCAETLTPRGIARARAVNAEMIDGLADFDPRRFTVLNLEFHTILFESCPNPHILDLVHRGWNRLDVLRDSTFSFVPHRASASVREHEQIVQLIEGGAPSLTIETAARDHRLNTVTALMTMEQQP